MSRHWREVITAVVSPQRVSVRVAAGAWRLATAAGHALDCPVGPPADAVPHALRLAVDDVERRRTTRAWLPRTRVDIVLSNDLAPVTLIAQVDHLQGDDERTAAARHAFAAVHGAAAQEWEIVVDKRARGDSALAVAVDPLLLLRLRSVVAEAGLVLRSVQPALGVAARATADVQRAWLVVAEAGKAIVARREGGRWLSVRTHRPRQSLAQDIGAWVDQARWMDGIDAIDHLCIATPQALDVSALRAAGWTVSLAPALEQQP